MCTVSWLHGKDGYQLFCNRDEKNTRLAACPPAIRALDGVKYIAPMDQGHGGSWISANEFGLTLALLNRSLPLVGTRSRGFLVTGLANAPNVSDLAKPIHRTDLSQYAGFTLVAIEPASPAHIFEWDGHNVSHLTDAEHCIPVTSSSVDQRGAEERRKAEFDARVRKARGLNEDVLFEFHRSHGLMGPAPTAYSTCMHREDASTVSFARVRVRKSGVEMFYSSGPPCQGGPCETVFMSKSAEAVSVC